MTPVRPLNYDPAAVDLTLSPNETMADDYYFAVGQSAIECINLALAAAGRPDPARVLDIPSGHGRVMRHLVKRFPQASIDACDLDRDGIEFCARQFGATPILSEPDLVKVRFEQKYDLIWVGSLFTHVARPVFERWAAALAQTLTPTGLIVASMHGRYSLAVQKTHPYINHDIWDQRILPGFEATGYGFASYTSNDEGRHGFIEDDYGISIACPSAVMEIIEAIPGVRVQFFGERAWIQHHDIVAFGPPGYDAPPS